MGLRVKALRKSLPKSQSSLFLIFIIAVLSGCVSEAQKLRSYCEHASKIIESGLHSGNPELVAEANLAHMTGDDFWYMEWEGQPILVPKLESGWELSPNSHSPYMFHEEHDYVMSMNQDFLDFSEESLAEMLLKNYGLPASNLTRFELIKRGLSLTLESVECNVENKLETINSYSALLAKSSGGTVIFSVDQAFILENGALLFRYKNGTAFTWDYLFSGGSDGSTKRIQITAKWPNYPDLFAKFPYMNGEPLWLEEFMQQASDSVPNTVQAMKELLAHEDKRLKGGENAL